MGLPQVALLAKHERFKLEQSREARKTESKFKPSLPPMEQWLPHEHWF